MRIQQMITHNPKINKVLVMSLSHRNGNTMGCPLLVVLRQRSYYQYMIEGAPQAMVQSISRLCID